MHCLIRIQLHRHIQYSLLCAVCALYVCMSKPLTLCSTFLLLQQFEMLYVGSVYVQETKTDMFQI